MKAVAGVLRLLTEQGQQRVLECRHLLFSLGTRAGRVWRGGSTSARSTVFADGPMLADELGKFGFADGLVDVHPDLDHVVQRLALIGNQHVIAATEVAKGVEGG